MPLEVLLQPKQMDLFQAILDPSGPIVLGYGGSRGAAKSGGVRRIALGLAMMTPETAKQFGYDYWPRGGVTIWIIRRVWDDLNKDHIQPLWTEYPELKQFYRAGDRELRIPMRDEKGAEIGHSSIYFVHAGDSGRAKRKSRGPQAHFIFLEQAEEFSQAEMEQLAGSNRAAGAPPGFCKRIYTFNPGGVGTNYLRRIFHKREYMENEESAHFRFIQGYGWDNYEWFRGAGIVDEVTFYEDPEWNREEEIEFAGAKIRTAAKRFWAFVQQTDFGRKMAAQPASIAIGELMGSFENFSGQYFADVWEQKSIVLSAELVARIVKPWWRRWLATDWGFSHYAATGWFASGMLSPEECAGLFGVNVEQPIRVIVLYRERITQNVSEPLLASLIMHDTPEQERREVRYHFIGHDAWKDVKRGADRSVVEQMDPVLAKGGLQRLSKADIDRVGGWRLMWNCWSITRKFRHWGGPGPFEQTAEDQPLFFVAACCPEVVDSIPMLVAGDIAEEENPQDVVKQPGQKHDDVGDMVRYGLKSYVTASPALPVEEEARRTYEKHQDPTERSIAMLRFQAEREKSERLQRRRRI